MRAASWARCFVPPLSWLARLAVPSCMTSSACDARAVSWARYDVPPLFTLALSKLASRAPGAPEPARGHVGSLRRHAASQAGALQVVVSGPGRPGACPARQVWIAWPMASDARSCGRSLLLAPASPLWSWTLAPTDARPSRATRLSPRLPSVNRLGLPRPATSFLAAISLSQGLTRPVGALHNEPGGGPSAGDSPKPLTVQ